ncbi:hypothetical protein AWZ03_004439 [Drosophila navojoa]|uniref:Uncharacterized protein n=1 Tax=Drosophila navojoa TaxID=7232 RepID=A0A484BJY9_DRONA|nr:hypothetical protein AWZ03_004439 [Drosophila navojoa]
MGVLTVATNAKGVREFELQEPCTGTSVVEAESSSANNNNSNNDDNNGRCGHREGGEVGSIGDNAAKRLKLAMEQQSKLEHSTRIGK